MDILMAIVNFVKDHGKEILEALGALYAFLLIVVKITPTKKDDELLGKIAGFVHSVAGFFGVKK